jgi:heme-degrading monooxygenase HmoA
MTLEYIRYTIPADQAERFIADYQAAREPLLRSPFAKGFEISRCVEDQTQFIVRIEWTSVEDHLKGFRSSAEFREFLGHIRPYIGMITEMRHYELC